MKKSSTLEWLTAAAIAGILSLSLLIPYVLGYLLARPGSAYTGLLVNVEDANYITIIQRGSEGAWMHSLRFTSEPDAPAFLYEFYLVWGHLARLLNVDATAMWHVARAVTSFITFVVTFGFGCTFLAGAFPRMVAYLLALFGAGFDWFAFPWESFDPTSAIPADLKMADAHLFSAALTFPHYLASITCLVILFWCALRLINESLARKKFSLLFLVGALANVGVILVYPFFVILSCAVLCLYVSILMLRARKIFWRDGMIVAGLIVPVVPIALYYANALASSELLRVWTAQSQTLSPNPLHYLLTFAPYLILAMFALRRDGLGDNKRALLWAWLVVVALLVYAPVGAQRRFLQGAQIPLAILATSGLFEVVLPRLVQTRWFEKLAHRPNYSAAGLQKLLVTLLVLLVSLSSGYQWLSAVLQNTMLQPYPFFRPRGEVEAMDWLRTHASADDVILSSYFTGSYLPYRSGARAYLGHVYETIHFREKGKQVDEFFAASTSDSAREQFLRENGIEYLFYGRAEKALGAFDPSSAAYLNMLISDSNAVIYQVALP